VLLVQLRIVLLLSYDLLPLLIDAPHWPAESTGPGSSPLTGITGDGTAHSATPGYASQGSALRRRRELRGGWRRRFCRVEPGLLHRSDVTFALVLVLSLGTLPLTRVEEHVLRGRRYRDQQGKARHHRSLFDIKLFNIKISSSSHQLGSTMRCQPGILVDVHSGPPLEP
jgi:hypothetical protein